MNGQTYNVSEILDVLTEIGNIGAGNAATALSKQLETDLFIDVTKVHFVLTEEVAETVGALDSPAVGIFMNTEEFGVGMIIFTMSSARKLVEIFRKNYFEAGDTTKDTWIPDEDERSALLEFGNICISSYVTVLSTILGRYIIPMPPEMAVDMLGSLIDLPVAQIAKTNLHALVIETRFISDNRTNTVSAHLLFIPSSDVQDELVRKMKEYGN